MEDEFREVGTSLEFKELPDYLQEKVSNWDKTRTACRGIVIDGERILLSYETQTNQYMIPGGGLENNESNEECCVRKIAEETGMIVDVSERMLEIDE